MAHELDFSAGDAAFVQFGDRVTAWHQFGRTITKEEFEKLSTEEKTRLVLERGRLLWTVDPDDVYTREGNLITGWKQFIRSDTSKLMGVFPESYTVLQNEDLFKLVEPMVDIGMAEFETAGVLREGEDVWALFRFNPQDPVVQEFFTEEGGIPYLLLSNNHARKRLLAIMETMIWVCCANTMGAALGTYGKRRQAGRYPGAVLLRHTKNVASLSVDAVNDLWGRMTERYQKVVASYKQMKQRFLEKEEFETFVLDLVAPLPEEDSPRFELTFEKAMQKRGLIEGLWNGRGRGITGDHSAFEAYMATSEALDHYPTVFKTRVDRLQAVFPGGSIANKKQDVLNALSALTQPLKAA